MNTRVKILTGTLLCMLLLLAPAGAITVNHLDITVAENGDALITGDYSMNWIEQAVVYPAGVSILAVNAPDNAVIHSISPNQVRVTVQKLVQVRRTADSTVYTTPAFSASDAQKELDQFWFANMVSLDLTPGTLTLTFPDGATVEDSDLSSVPSFVYTIAM